MKLVLFTSHYPYGNKETFLYTEVLFASNYFDEIVVVTKELPPYILNYNVPQNLRIICYRENAKNFQRIPFFFSRLFVKKFWKEVMYGVSQYGIKRLKGIITSVLVEDNIFDLLNKCKEKWIQKDFTIYYSYWLGTEARLNDNINGLWVSRAHGGDCFYNRGFHPYREESLEQLDYIFPISEAGKKDLLYHYTNKVQNLDKKIKTTYLGVIVPQIEKAKHWTSSKGKLIVTCSNIIPLKRLDIIINALSLIDQFDVRWIHFGSGYSDSEIKKLASDKLQSKNNILWEFRGQTKPDDIFQFYENNNVDCFVNCSDYEGIPVSIIEAFSYGIPAIAKDVGGMSELVNNENGILLNKNANKKDFANALIEILTLDEETMTFKRLSAYATAKEKFNADSNYRLFYDELIKKYYEKT